VFTTAADNQTSVEVHVLQGERPMARDNRTLGKFHLVGIPPAPRQVPQIEVTFDIDANGILNVSAQDKASGKQQQITITASSGLSKSDVERMVKEAEAHAQDDAQRRQEIQLRNETDALAYSVQRLLAEQGAKLSDTERSEAERALTEARDALQSGDMDRVRRAQETLTRASQTLSGAAARQPTSAPRGGGQPSGAPSDGDVVDAEFHDVDERKSA